MAQHQRKRWSELSPAAKVAVVVGAALELAVTVMAARDLSRRQAIEVRGPKLLWWPALFVQPIGSPLYLLLGRRPPR